MSERIYAAIDLKSFYASVECMERGLDPMTTNLVVADASRTEKTICLAVTPSLKKVGVGGRARLFEVVSKVKEENARRLSRAPGHVFKGSSYFAPELENNPSLSLDFIIAPPQMAKYIDISTKIYHVYLQYIAASDIHVYSIDEVFIDMTQYLALYHMTAQELCIRMIRDVMKETGITATAGVGTNLYLAKIAMDIMAKHVPADENGVRMAYLDEMTYKKKLWTHEPLTDFWRIGHGYAKKLQAKGLYTMGDIARCSLGEKHEYYNEDLLYKMFGVNAEFLIDHAWGYEPCLIKNIKDYRPKSQSISRGQVLKGPYSAQDGRMIVGEMVDLIVMELVNQHLVSDQIVLTIVYDIENLSTPEKRKAYSGEIETDRYGREIPKTAHASMNIDGGYTSSTKKITKAFMTLYDSLINKELTIRRVYVVMNHTIPESKIPKEEYTQLDLFTDFGADKQAETNEADEKEKNIQKAILSMKEKYGKNAIVKGMNLKEGATTIERNDSIGGHKA